MLFFNYELVRPKFLKFKTVMWDEFEMDTLGLVFKGVWEMKHSYTNSESKSLDD